MKLCRRLEEHDVYIHIDGKSLNFPIKTLKGLKNVTVLDNRIKVFWSHYSTVRATVELMKSAIAKNQLYSHLVIISGSCYPVQPINNLVNLLNNNLQRSFIQCVEVKRDNKLFWKQLCRFWKMNNVLNWRIVKYSRIFYKSDTLIRQIVNKACSYFPRNFEHYFPNIKPFFGSNWFALSIDAASFIIKTITEDKRYPKYFENVYAPEEFIFPTILMNSTYCAQLIGESDFDGQATNRKAPLHFVDQDICKGVYETKKIFNNIKQSKKYFVRKLSSKKNNDLIEIIDREIDYR
jgi:hypothetical protein